MSRSAVIVECDVLPEILKGDIDQYSQLFSTAFGQARPDWSFEVVQAHQGQMPPLDPSRLYIITGSKHDAFADTDWIAALRDWVRQAKAANLAVVGICFGHQLIAHALGGRSGRAGAWGLGRMPARAVTDLPIPDAELLVSHQDQVLELPVGATRLMASDFCPNYAFQVDGLIGIQGHPEFTPEHVTALANDRKDRIGLETFERAIASMNKPANGQAVINWLCQHLETYHESNAHS